jgi:hypothetical protein
MMPVLLAAQTQTSGASAAQRCVPRSAVRMRRRRARTTAACDEAKQRHRHYRLPDPATSRHASCRRLTATVRRFRRVVHLPRAQRSSAELTYEGLLSPHNGVSWGLEFPSDYKNLIAHYGDVVLGTSSTAPQSTARPLPGRGGNSSANASTPPCAAMTALS